MKKMAVTGTEWKLATPQLRLLVINETPWKKYNRRTITTIQASVSEEEEESRKEIVAYERSLYICEG
jgi:hypothetical protein